MLSTPQSDSKTQQIPRIAYNSKLHQIAKQNNLNICMITWEDTARSKGSCWGPNISDMTLRLDKENILLPMIRRPNFRDETADIPIDRFTLTVGNETEGAPVSQMTLKEYLENKDGLIKDISGKPVKSLLCKKRDDVILTSAQYCILPLHEGTCEFNVHLYNYQSSTSDPAVLVIVASAKGSSAQAIYGGITALYFNNAGKAANYVAERLKDERERLGKATEGKMDQDEQERNTLMIYQIPLKVKPMNNFGGLGGGFNSFGTNCMKKKKSRGIDNAVLSVGKTHSDFKGITNSEIERDPRFPIRCTIQFYKVTDEDDVPEKEFIEMAENINRIYKSADKSGSLVIENSDRKTEWVQKEEDDDEEYKEDEEEEEKGGDDTDSKKTKGKKKDNPPAKSPRRSGSKKDEDKQEDNNEEEEKKDEEETRGKKTRSNSSKKTNEKQKEKSPPASTRLTRRSAAQKKDENIEIENEGEEKNSGKKSRSNSSKRAKVQKKSETGKESTETTPERGTKKRKGGNERAGSPPSTKAVKKNDKTSGKR